MAVATVEEARVSGEPQPPYPTVRTEPKNHVGGTEHATESRHARYSAGTESIEFNNPTFSARIERLDIYIACNLYKGKKSGAATSHSKL